MAAFVGIPAARADEDSTVPLDSVVPLNTATLAEVADHTPLDRPEEQTARTALLEHVAATPTAILRRDARRWLLRRRRDLPEFRDDPRASIDLFADALADPEAARGEAFVLWGRTLAAGDVEPVDGAHVVRIALHDVPDSPVLVLLPAQAAAPPPAGTPVVAAGRFLKLVGEGELTFPVFVAGGLTILGDQLDPELMQDVANLERRQPAERDAYLTALAHARLADTDRLAKLARDLRAERSKAKKFTHPVEKFPTYVDLFQELNFTGRQPNAYQGRPVTLTGHVWSISKEPVAGTAEEYGFEHFYSLLLYTEDSQTVPTLVICTELPPGLPTSGTLANAIDGITVTGFVFKLQVYDDQNGDPRKMPVVIARSVTWQTPPEVDIVPRFGPTAYAIVAAVLLGLVALAWWIGTRDHAKRRAILDERTEGEPTFDNVTEHDGRIEPP